MTSTSKAPVGSGTVAFWAALLSIVLLVLGGLGVREALVEWNAIDGSPWISDAGSQLVGLDVGPWAVITGAIAAFFGLWFIVSALAPRPRTTVALKGKTGSFVPARGLAFIAVTTAEDVDGVLSASSTSTKRRVRVQAKATATTPELRNAVRSAVEERLTAFERPPKVTVSLKQHKEDSE